MFPFKERDGPGRLRKCYTSLYSVGNPKTFEINCYMLTYPTKNVLITQQEQATPQKISRLKSYPDENFLSEFKILKRTKDNLF